MVECQLPKLDVVGSNPIARFQASATTIPKQTALLADGDQARISLTYALHVAEVWRVVLPVRFFAGVFFFVTFFLAVVFLVVRRRDAGIADS